MEGTLFFLNSTFSEFIAAASPKICLHTIPNKLSNWTKYPLDGSHFMLRVCTTCEAFSFIVFPVTDTKESFPGFPDYKTQCPVYTA